jgi:hypothetical protein
VRLPFSWAPGRKVAASVAGKEELGQVSLAID